MVRTVSSLAVVILFVLVYLVPVPAWSAGPEGGGAHITGTVFITQYVAPDFLHPPMPGFAVTVVTDEGPVGSCTANGTGAFLVEVPAGKQFYLRVEAPPEFPVPFIPALSQYFVLQEGAIVLTEVPMAAQQLVAVLPGITDPPIALGPTEGVIEALFENATGSRIPGAQFSAEGFSGLTYFMTDVFPLIKADPPYTHSPGVALLIGVPETAEISCTGQSPDSGPGGTVAVPVQAHALTNILYSDLNDQAGVSLGRKGAAAGTVITETPAGTVLLTVPAVKVSCQGRETYANTGGAFLLVDLPPRRSVTIRASALEYFDAVSDPVTLTPGQPILLDPLVMERASFVRGDVNADGAFDIGDACSGILFLFQGARRAPCLDAADVNDDGQLDLADPIYTLQALFCPGVAIPAPWSACGEDPTEDLLGCSAFGPCQ